MGRLLLVTGAEIDEHIRKYEQTINEGEPMSQLPSPKGVRGLPGRGNLLCQRCQRTELPNTSQGLAGFHDEDGDGLHNPQTGTTWIIEIRGCEEPLCIRQNDLSGSITTTVTSTLRPMATPFR